MRKNFKWCVATSSFQIEGSNDVDDKIRSIWDEFCDNPEKIKNSDHAKIACDHYNRYNDDKTSDILLGSVTVSNSKLIIGILSPLSSVINT